MLKKLTELASNPSYDAHLIPIGKSPGYLDDKYALDIWSLQIPATVESKQTAIFASGHHYKEISGPETVYYTAKHILESDSAGNLYVKKMRESTRLVFIPQIDVDAFNRLSFAYGTPPLEFRIHAYERYLDEDNIDSNILECNRILVFKGDTNYYHFPADEFDYNKLPDKLKKQLFEPYKSIMDSISKIVEKYGPPTLACDYHENRTGGEFFILSNDIESLPIIHNEVGKTYPILNEHDLRSVMEYFQIRGEDDKSFGAYMEYLGAHSFTLEPPRNGGDRELSSRIKMNLIATDRILWHHRSAFNITH